MAQCRADMNHVWRCRNEGLTVPLVKSECNNICDLTELGFDFRQTGVRATKLIRVSRDSRSSSPCPSFFPTTGMISSIYRAACISPDLSGLWSLKYLLGTFEIRRIFGLYWIYRFVLNKKWWNVQSDEEKRGEILLWNCIINLRIANENGCKTNTFNWRRKIKL